MINAQNNNGKIPAREYDNDEIAKMLESTIATQSVETGSLDSYKIY